jgi:hypothetical protein
VPVPALKRHQDEHLRNLAVRVRTNPSSVLVDLERVETDAWTVVEMGRGLKSPTDPDKWIIPPNPTLILKALAEVRETKVAMVKLAKELAMFNQDMVSRETYKQMTDLVLKALQMFPEALAAVQNALAEVEE